MVSSANFLKSEKRVPRLNLAALTILGALSCVIELAIPGGRCKCLASQDQQLLKQPATAIPTLANGDLYALVVGISRYENPGIPALQGAANDARAFAKFLETQRDLFKNLKITLLTDEQATKDTLDDYLAREAPRAGKEETLILFFSGHGAVDPKHSGRFHFLTPDADHMDQ